MTVIRDVRWGSRWPVLGFGALGFSVAVMLLLHVLAAGQINPVDEVLSDYVFAPSGWLFDVSTASFAVAGFGALAGLAGVGMLRSRAMRVAFSLLLLGLLLLALFPTDRVGAESVSAFVHRYAAGLVLFSLPAAGLLVAAALARRGRLPGYVSAVRRTVAATAAVLAFFLCAHLQLMPQFTRDVLGISERLLFAGEVLLLAQLLYLPARYRGQLR